MVSLNSLLKVSVLFMVAFDMCFRAPAVLRLRARRLIISGSVLPGLISCCLSVGKIILVGKISSRAAFIASVTLSVCSSILAGVFSVGV